jgi:DEAD/DEAH box helicase domain-containing protein
VPIPDWLHPDLQTALGHLGYQRLYAHQVRAIEAAALRHEDLVITTPTASGKSLAYQVPIVQAVLESSSQASRSLYLAPTKALIYDQQDKLRALVEALARCAQDLRVVTLTGDTAGDRALLFQPTPHLLLSNPDCLNNLLYKAQYSQFGGLKRFLRELRYIVLDEAHSYTDLFGCHVANLMKRIKLAVVRAGGQAEQLQFVLASATIGNPTQMWQTLCYRSGDTPVAVIDQNTAPFPGRLEVYCNGRNSSKRGVAELLNRLIAQGSTTIVFVESRKAGQDLLNLMRREQRRFGRPETHIDQFHGTLGANQRGEIARRIRAGTLKLIVATSALEQGVDFPQIDAAVVWGFPTVNRLRQRFGRAGRGNRPGLAVFVPRMNRTIDLYYARCCSELRDAPAESLHLNPNYLPRLKEHVQAAAGESGIAIRDELLTLFGDAGVRAALALQQVGAAEVRGGYLVAERKAATAIAMRGIPIRQVKLVDEDLEVIEEFSQSLAIRELHPGAIYLSHSGEGELGKWQVNSLNLEQQQAIAEPMNPNSPFSTRALLELNVTVDETIAAQSRTVELGGSGAALTLTLEWGTVAHQVVGYETLISLNRVRCVNEGCRLYHRKLSQQQGQCSHCGEPLQLADSSTEVVKTTLLEQPLSESYDAPLLRIQLNEAAGRMLNHAAERLTRTLSAAFDEIPHEHEDLLIVPPELLGLHTLSHLLFGSLPTLSQPLTASDLIQSGIGQPNQVLLFDEAHLGTGCCECIYEHTEDLLQAAYRLAAECDCIEGCPKCCHSSHCSDRNGGIYRPLAVSFLEAVLS